MKITKLETFIVPPRWCFLKIETDEGITGSGANRSSKAARIRWPPPSTNSPTISSARIRATSKICGK